MVANIYMCPTPYLADPTGQLSGYVAPNVLLDQNGQPIVDDQGNYVTSN
jgi:hypothetical protein